MSGFSAFGHGLRDAAGRGRLALLLYAAHALLALPAAYAFQAALRSAFGLSLAQERLLAGFEFTLWIDFLRDHGGVLRTLAQTAAGMGVLALLVGPFLAGGVLAMAGPHAAPFSAAAFFRSCGEFYGRFLRLALVIGGLLLLVFAASILLLGMLFGMLSTEAVSEVSFVTAGAAGVTLAAAALGLVLLAGDYARIAMFRQNSRGTLRAVRTGVVFMLRNFLPVATLQILTLALLAILTGLYLGLDQLLGAESAGGILLLVLLQQGFLYARALLRVAAVSAELGLFEERRVQPFLLYGWEDSPGRSITGNTAWPAGG